MKTKALTQLLLFGSLLLNVQANADLSFNLALLPVNNSGVSGEIALRLNNSQLFDVKLIAKGLVAGQTYKSFFHANSECLLVAQDSILVGDPYVASPEGQGIVERNSIQNLNMSQVGSVSIYDNAESNLLACGTTASFVPLKQ
jgi:hypothetical protein